MKGLQLKLMVSVLVVVFAGVPIASAFSTPITSPVVVLFGHSAAELAVVEQIHKDFPSSIVVDYGSLPALLVLFRAVGQVVFVAHGSPDGVTSPFGLLSWAAMARVVESTPAHMRYLAACYSSNAVALLDVRAVGFPGAIDADLAAIAISALMWYAQGALANAQHTLSRFYAVALAKCLDPSLVQPLYFGPTEALWNTVDVLIWLLGFVIGATFGDQYYRHAMAAEVVPYVATFGEWFCACASGAMSLIGLMGNLFWFFITNIVPLIAKYLLERDFILIGVKIASFFLPIVGQVLLAIWLAAAAIELAIILINVFIDCNDTDDVYGSTVPTGNASGGTETDPAPPSGGGGGGYYYL